jgi:hypothetical protein
MSFWNEHTHPTTTTLPSKKDRSNSHDFANATLRLQRYNSRMKSMIIVYMKSSSSIFQCRIWIPLAVIIATFEITIFSLDQTRTGTIVRTENTTTVESITGMLSSLNNGIASERVSRLLVSNECEAVPGRLREHFICCFRMYPVCWIYPLIRLLKIKMLLVIFLCVDVCMDAFKS